MPAWSTHPDDHVATAAAVGTPCSIAVESACIGHCDGMSARVHGVLNEVLVREQDTHLTIAFHLAIAEGSAVLTVDLQPLDPLQLLFTADGFTGLFHDFLRA